MKLFSALIPAQDELSPTARQKELKAVLTPHEKVGKVYPFSPEVFIFTDKRLIIKMADTPVESAIPCHSIPYRSITHFSLDAPADSNTEMQLSIWLHGDPVPLQKTLESSPLIPDLHRTLADYVLNKHTPWLDKQLASRKRSGLRTAQVLGLAGAGIFVLHFKRSHPKKKDTVSNTACPATALLGLLRKGLKG